MNPAVNEDELPAAEGPGAQLKALRESQKLDISRVATLLHLNEEKLEALEADDYAQLPSPVFVQGYFRNYARFLGVPVEPILNAYHAKQPEKGRLPDLKITQISHEVGSSHVLVRLITWTIIIGLLALVVVWWRGYLQWPAGLQIPAVNQLRGQPEETQPEGEAAELPDAGMLTRFGEDGQAALLLPAAGDSDADGGGQPAAADSAGQSQTSEQAAADGPDSPSPLQQPAPAPATERAEPAAGPMSGAGADTPGEPDAVVIVQFDGASWTKITDASGTFSIIGEVKAGTRQALQGTPPYDLVLGKAEAVRVFVHGREFDITPYTRGNVARFRLDPQRVER